MYYCCTALLGRWVRFFHAKSYHHHLPFDRPSQPLSPRAPRPGLHRPNPACLLGTSPATSTTATATAAAARPGFPHLAFATPSFLSWYRSIRRETHHHHYHHRHDHHHGYHDLHLHGRPWTRHSAAHSCSSSGSFGRDAHLSHRQKKNRCSHPPRLDMHWRRLADPLPLAGRSLVSLHPGSSSSSSSVRSSTCNYADQVGRRRTFRSCSAARGAPGETGEKEWRIATGGRAGLEAGAGVGPGLRCRDVGSLKEAEAAAELEALAEEIAAHDLRYYLVNECSVCLACYCCMSVFFFLCYWRLFHVQVL